MGHSALYPTLNVSAVSIASVGTCEDASQSIACSVAEATTLIDPDGNESSATVDQKIKDTELLLSGDALESFRKLPQSEKRKIVQEVLRKAVISAIDDEIIDYFKQINAGGMRFKPCYK